MPVIVQAPSCCFWPNLNPISNPAIRPIPANSFSITPPLHFLKTNNFHSPNVTSAKGHRFFNTASVRAAASARADYYSTLNVSRNATLQEIKSSYRKLARKVSLYMCVCVCVCGFHLYLILICLVIFLKFTLSLVWYVCTVSSRHEQGSWSWRQV